MRLDLSLSPHPDTPCAAVTGITVEVTSPAPDFLAFRFRVSGDVDAILLPPPAPPERTDGLWQHTVFEAFLRPAEGNDYFEFNFAPSGQWAAYSFAGYREGMAEATMMAPPVNEAGPRGDGYELQASLAFFPDDGEAWRLGLSAVIEDKSGVKSYWALAHPPGKPDFHHSDGFAVQLPPA